MYLLYFQPEVWWRPSRIWCDDKLVDCDKPNHPHIELSICPKRWSTMCGPRDIWWGPLYEEATEIYRSCKHAGSKYRILCITFCTSARVSHSHLRQELERRATKSQKPLFLMLVVVCAIVQVFGCRAVLACTRQARCEHRRDGCEILDDMLGTLSSWWRASYAQRRQGNGWTFA